jgi:ribosomal protein S8E
VPSAYNAGFTVKFLADVANTGPASLNVNSLGAKTIKKKNDADLETGDIEANQIVEVVYNSTDDVFEMTSQVASVVNVSVEKTQTSVTAGEDLTAGDAVYIKPADGEAYKCDA